MLAPCPESKPGDWNSRFECYLPKLPVGDTFKQNIANALFFVALIQSVPTAILAHSVWKTQKSAGLNLWAYYIQLLISAFWVAYGMIIRSVVVTLASSLLIITTLVLIYLIVKDRTADKAAGRDD